MAGLTGKQKIVIGLLVVIVAMGLAVSQTWAASAEPKNLIADYNPGFKDQFNSDNIPGWNIAYGAAKVVTDAKSGKQSLWCSNNVKLYSNKLVDAEPGYTYHISAWGKFKNFKFIGKGYGVGFGLEQQNEEKISNGVWYDMQTYLKYAEGDTGWVFAQAKWTPKGTTKYFSPFLLVWAEPGSEVWFDDIRVWKEKLPNKKIESKLNIIENGSFEVRYQLGRKANRFEPKASKELYDTYNKRMITVEDFKHSGQASMKIEGECTIVSYVSYLDSRSAEASIALKTVNVKSKGAGGFARLVFFDKKRRVLKTQSVASQKGTLDWTLYKVSLKNIDPRVRSVQWEFGMDKGSTGSAYFDDLDVSVPTTIAAIPYRPKNTAHAAVTIDCSVKKENFESPLNAYDCQRMHLVYSPTIGTAGKFLEGTGRWFEARPNLGFKYVRISSCFLVPKPIVTGPGKPIPF